MNLLTGDALIHRAHMFMILCMPFVAQSYFVPQNTMMANGNTRTQKIVPILPIRYFLLYLFAVHRKIRMYEKHGASRAIQIILYDQPPPRSPHIKPSRCLVVFCDVGN